MVNNFDEIAIFNTVLGLVNYSKNLEQIEHNQQLEKKINKILEILQVKNEIN